ncbi:RagB/SusD family nutrient uptake outer membrane protein [Mangrovivirga sp. M17]|uniref:RagB/SusD family nutrient uptake outer membrane protein n=1 Tax=Mangrovivirga halotolerans TaxID=2993936 RepID=A0ABT3RQU2_9BACT|nr:RagB/SusD family nutrient uptake outer membrane protein [Mangrovivirga halotolerans]MCX2743952.1 RagB/SusD family nutrient uptake outer membrane protein [Mangrovivirga halotolerans]
MRKYYKYIIAILLLSSGCESILDVEPTDIIIEDQAFKSLRDVEAGAIAAYGFVSEENIIEFSSLASDDVLRPSTNSGHGVQINSWAYVASNNEAADLWYNAYRSIAQANRVLYSIDQLINNGEIKNDEISSANHLKSEMLALRAHQHLNLYRAMGEKYGNDALAVPYMDLEDNNNNNRPDGLETDLKPARLKCPEFFEELFDDIDQALQNITIETVNSQNIYRFNYYAIKALEARAALYSEKYDRAINASNDVINNVDLCSFNDYENLWLDSESSGVLFKLNRTVNDDFIGRIWTFNLTDISFAPSNELVDLLSPYDIRYYTTFYKPENGERIVYKYPGKVGGYWFLNDVKVYRVSEMYLIRAEASLKKINIDIDQANEDLMSLRNERIYLYNHNTINDKDQLINEILLERRKEFAYEGHRFFDLKRNQLPLERSPLDCGGSIPCELEAGNFRFNLPIPQEEVFANKNIQQNPGYGQN